MDAPSSAVHVARTSPYPSQVRFEDLGDFVPGYVATASLAGDPSLAGALFAYRTWPLHEVHAMSPDDYLDLLGLTSHLPSAVETVAYLQALQDAVTDGAAPPIVVDPWVFDAGDGFLDGAHRASLARDAGLNEIHAYVRTDAPPWVDS